VKEGPEKLNQHARDHIVRDDSNSSNVTPLTGAPRQLRKRKRFVALFREWKKLRQQAKIVFTSAHVALTERKVAAHITLVHFLCQLSATTSLGYPVTTSIVSRVLFDMSFPANLM